MSKASISYGLKAAKQVEVHKPKIYKVILLNDDFTPMDFVVAVLIEVFHHDPSSAERLMWQVHHQGKAVAGMYPCDIAKTRQWQVNQIAMANQFPLRCDLEVA